MNEAPTEIRDLLAEVCGYHDGPDCERCAGALEHRRDKLGWTWEQIAADIQLYQNDRPEWERRVRERGIPQLRR